MLCEKFINMTVPERIVFIGKINHAAMSDERVFDFCTKMIELWEQRGIFNDVTIMPAPITENQPT